MIDDYLRILGSKSGEIEIIELDYKYFSINRLLKHLKKLPCFKIKKTRSWMLTDDVWIDFEYKEYKFLIESPFVHYWISKEEDCPESVFFEIIEHIKNYKPGNLVRLSNYIKNNYENI